jgi:hypothetical protein
MFSLDMPGSRSTSKRCAAASLLALSSCAGAPPATQAGPAAADGVVWSYEVRAGAGFDLDVEATFRGPIAGELRIDDDAARFLDGLALAEGASWRPLDRRDDRWISACATSCRARYRVRLREAAVAIADVDTALAAGGAVFAPPSTWLLRPAEVPAQGRYRFHVVPAAGARFATGVRPAPTGAADTYEAAVGTLEQATFAGFGPLHVVKLAPGIEAAIAPSAGLPDEVVERWLRTEVDVISAYLGRPPDDRIMLLIAPGTSEVMRGKTLGDGGAAVLVRVGTRITAANVLDDWVVAHELVHVGFPALDREHAWFAEGLASYVEPFARARAGLVPAEKLWADLVEGFPQGLPPAGDPGLDGNEAWGRVYWGGALYFLLADLGIREHTRGARSLDDAVRAVHAAGGNVEVRWPLARILDEGDRATGTRVLHELYDRFAHVPGTVDLDALWARLGVLRDGKGVRFDEKAPLAATRAAMTARPGPVSSPTPPPSAGGTAR